MKRTLSFVLVINKRVASGIGNCALRTDCLAVIQANHCSDRSVYRNAQLLKTTSKQPLLNYVQEEIYER